MAKAKQPLRRPRLGIRRHPLHRRGLQDLRQVHLRPRRRAPRPHRPVQRRLRREYAADDRLARGGGSRRGSVQGVGARGGGGEYCRKALTPLFVIPAVAKHCRRQNAGTQSQLASRPRFRGDDKTGSWRILRSMTGRRPWWKSILLSALALAFGVAVAVVLASVFFWMTWEGGFLTRGEMASAAAGFSAIIALQLLVVCVPIWLLLDKLRLAGWVSAVALGFVAPFAYW